MRTEFAQTLTKIARQDRNTVLVTGDLGFGVLDEFAREFPTQYFNAGVSEQNMTGLAVGLALEGKIVYTYSIGNFPTLRCLEQIRNDACYHNANVKIVVIGGGLAYGALGMSHQATEDIAIMRALPNMVVVCPCDFAEAVAATHAMIEHEGPLYYRCGYKKEPPIHEKPIEFKLGRAIRVREGAEAAIIFTGTIGNQAVAAADALEKDGIHCRLVSMHTVKPLDNECVVAAARETGAVITLEEHNAAGGPVGSAAATLLDACIQPKKFLTLALPDRYVSQVGSHEWLLDQFGLSAPRIEASVRRL